MNRLNASLCSANMKVCFEVFMAGSLTFGLVGLGLSMFWIEAGRRVRLSRMDMLVPTLFFKNSYDSHSGNVTRSRTMVADRTGLSDETTRENTQFRASSVLYHRYWDVNCSAIFAGKMTAIKNVSRVIQKERKMRPIMPLDRTVMTWTRDCAKYKRQRGYPRLAHSDEEASFPLAYIIVTHKGSAQVERLLRAIYQPQNIYCIHPDSKSSGEFHQAISGLTNCFDNVFIASKIEDVQYAGFTRLLADINCMKDLMGPRASAYPWKYAINLCGQDFPLKTNLEIVRQLKAYNGHNEIKGYVPPSYKRKWTHYTYTVRKNVVVRTKKLKTRAPHNLTLYAGSAYYAITRDFVNYTLRDPVAQDFLHWVRDTYSPDEAFWASLQRAPGVPGGSRNAVGAHNSVRYVRWTSSNKTPRCHGKYIRTICIFGTGDLPHLIKEPQLFVNKFHYEFDPVTMQCLEGALEFRVQHPKESEKLPDFPVRYSEYF